MDYFARSTPSMLWLPRCFTLPLFRTCVERYTLQNNFAMIIGGTLCLCWARYELLWRQSAEISQDSARARFLSLSRDTLRLCSVSHRSGHWRNLPIIDRPQPELTPSKGQKTGLENLPHIVCPVNTACQWAACRIRKIAGCTCYMFKRFRHELWYVHDARAIMHARIAN